MRLCAHDVLGELTLRWTGKNRPYAATSTGQIKRFVASLPSGFVSAGRTHYANNAPVLQSCR